MVYGSTFQYKNTRLSLVNIISGTALELITEKNIYLYILQGDGTIKSNSVRPYHKLEIYLIRGEEAHLHANSDSVVLMINAKTELYPDLVKVLGRQISALKYSTGINISALSSYLSVSTRLNDKYGICVKDFTRVFPCKADSLKAQSSELFKILLRELRASRIEGT
jgi:hypothetical protein